MGDDPISRSKPDPFVRLFKFLVDQNYNHKLILSCILYHIDLEYKIGTILIEILFFTLNI